jgi:arsenate reductase
LITTPTHAFHVTESIVPELNVLFVCQHGAAKSVIAARHLEALAQARGLSVSSTAAGLEPDDAIPPHVVDGLRADGVDDHVHAPRAISGELLENADIVVAFGCDLSAFPEVEKRVIHWSGVPAVSDGYDAARAAILERLPAVLDEAKRLAAERIG